ncbi:MAG TPA: aminoglycoside 6-adenylyltransferase, partial [Caldilineaceae bacterium]|nr:aminoglycoside 6-adenylyltransferase [Caldilineaceae bacterium]
MDPLDTLRRWANAQESVCAMLLTSTRAVPQATVDRYSDYDVILVVDDIHPYYADRSWLEEFGEVLVSYWDPIHRGPDDDLERFANVIQFTSGLKIDFTLWPVALLQRIAAAAALPAELDAGYLVLLDKEQLTAGLRPPTYQAYIPARPSEQAFQTLVEEFFSDAPYVAKSLWRDELMPAKLCLDYDMKHVYLRQLLEWRVEIDHNWSAPVGALGKGLKKRLPPAIWSYLEGAFAGADTTFDT